MNYANNIKYLKQYYPSLLSIIDENRESLDPNQQLLTRNNEPNMKFSIDGHEFLLHSKYNAYAEAQKWASTIRENVKSGHVILFGIGMGYFLEALLELTEVTYVYVCEPSREIFNHMIEARDIRTFLRNPKIKLLAVGSDDLLLAQLGKLIAADISTEMTTAVPNIYTRLYSDVYKSFIENIKNSLTDQVGNFHTYQTFQDVWTENLLNNIPYTITCPPLNFAEGMMKGKTAIIVGSGPSLSRDIDHLRQLKDKCLIIAAGSSIQALQKNGIQPHFVVSVDGSEPNLRVFENADTLGTPLFFAPEIHYEILERYQDQMAFVLMNNNSLADYLYSDRNIPKFISTRTVTGTAIQIAEYMGANKIILTGQDMSYPENQFYSAGVNHISDEAKNTTVNSANLLIDNVEGGKNPTTQSMLITLQDIELLIKIISRKGVEFINASQKGATIGGTEYRSLDSMMEELNHNPSEDIDFRNNIQSPTLEEQQRLFSQMTSKLKYVVKQTDLVEKKLKLLLDILNKLNAESSIRNKAKVSQSLSEIDDLWQWITKQETFTAFYTFSRDHYINIYKRYVPMIIESRDVFEKSNLIVKHLGNLARNIQIYLPQLRGMLQNTIDRIQAYQSLESEA
ncbi:DUF115 domain-containing protein [Paenibacillus chibensis]|uniref:DUF115 domain-containing protein n=1 Tax=Paenibacillus chibensis TaxID=59846 RepID=A0ABU6PU71_9BACL|nr:DUF115 domain-containing protein [Paenibacillus chibensis]